MTKKKQSANKTKPLRFDEKLVLNQWALSLFGAGTLEELAEGMKDEKLEGLDEENVSRFYHHLANRSFTEGRLNRDKLLLYDQNIVRHTRRIQGRRELPVTWKYFQYLSLLFAEIYLDSYFSAPDALAASLNEYVDNFNADKTGKDKVDHFTPKDLNKLAFWNATGSGKTLIMHVNILQYRHYLDLSGKRHELNRIILLTPNEGLSRQHLNEFYLSGLEAEFFNKDGATLFTGRYIEIIDIHKLRDEMGVKTVAVEAFEGNNLVLVDEGHRGSSGVEWKEKRDQLCEKGFSFEYSATFGQAMKASGKNKLIQEYARCILFDYSYRYFYHDGYGKDYQILNLAEDENEETRKLYLTACLLAFYQQLRLFGDKASEFTSFLLEKPLWVFVGGSVKAVRTENKRKVSDVVDILLTLSEFVKEEKDSIAMLERLLSGKPGLLDSNKREIFANRFNYLIARGQRAPEVYRDIIKTVFNASASGASLHIENLKGVEGEIGLRVGDNDYFGVINVGDDSDLVKLCEVHGLSTDQRDFSESLFHRLNSNDSRVNILIGSKKFTEGWSSWRVSTMGLMNVGKKEGSEIIQLFGRGVRLKGKDFSLKRSRTLLAERAPKYIDILETLNTYGVRAGYMAQFKEYLEEEGIPGNENRIEFVLPVIKNLDKGKKLKILRLKEKADFSKQGPRPFMEKIKNVKVALDWYPKVEAMENLAVGAHAGAAVKDEGKLSDEHLAFIDLDDLYFELQRFKDERGWHNFSISKTAIAALLRDGSWYTLYIPKDQLQFTGFDKIRRWQDLAAQLLKKYCAAFYTHKKNEWELPNLEYQELTQDDPNFVDEYKFYIDQSEEAIVEKLKALKAKIDNRKLKGLDLRGFIYGRFSYGKYEPFGFDRHLYGPLIHIAKDTATVEVAPVHLNEGERDFVQDLRSFFENNKDYFKDKELYLLRNMSRGRGVGFFEAGNFHPDFILWLLADKKQYITFVDPKGIRNLKGKTDPKIEFHKSIKDIEKRLDQPDVVLNSFVISVTPYSDVSQWMKQEEFEAHNVLFQKDDKVKYVGKMLNRVDGVVSL